MKLRWQTSVPLDSRMCSVTRHLADHLNVFFHPPLYCSISFLFCVHFALLFRAVLNLSSCLAISCILVNLCFGYRPLKIIISQKKLFSFPLFGFYPRSIFMSVCLSFCLLPSVTDCPCPCASVAQSSAVNSSVNVEGNAECTFLLWIPTSAAFSSLIFPLPWIRLTHCDQRTKHKKCPFDDVAPQ